MAAAVPFMSLSSDAEQQQPVGGPSVSNDASSAGYALPLNQDLVSQVSKGSFTGFLLGLLVSVFSKSLVLLLGLAITLQSLAGKVGIDLAHHLKLKEHIRASKILSALSRNTAFKLAFGVTFTLSAFMHF